MPTALPAAGSGVRLLVVWALGDDLGELYGDPTEIWKLWADDVRRVTIDSGHHMAEEAPEELAMAIRSLLVR